MDRCLTDCGKVIDGMTYISDTRPSIVVVASQPCAMLTYQVEPGKSVGIFHLGQWQSLQGFAYC